MLFRCAGFGWRTFYLRELTDTGEKMSNYSKRTKQDMEAINEVDFFEDVLKDDRELFKQALSDALNSKIRKYEEEIKDIEMPRIGKSE